MRLIDADALKADLDAWVRLINRPELYSRDDALHIIDNMPTILNAEQGLSIPIENGCNNCLYKNLQYNEEPCASCFEADKWVQEAKNG